MERFFNTEGPCERSRHYMLSPTARLPTIHQLIERGKYLVLHAPRQVGKTTALLALSRELSAGGRYISAVLSMEVGEPFRGLEQLGPAEDAILRSWRADVSSQLDVALQPPAWPATDPGVQIRAALTAWALAAPLPLVLFIDEIDALQGPILVSALRQLHSGYPHRPGGAPWSIALCGMRDVRDYRMEPDTALRSRSSSPFNVKESLTLRLFTCDEVAALYQQHTEATNRGCAITETHVDRAREAIILRRETHLDSLVERLREPRVRHIIEPILLGDLPAADMLNDDLVYARDLGLIARDPPVRIANAIYQEVIPRALSFQVQEYLDQRAAWYLRPDGSLDMILLLASFQEFFAEHGESWMGRFDYKEAGPHLLLMAFLQQVANGQGRIRREFAAGSGRADIVVEYGPRRSVLELKLRRGSQTEEEGLRQLCAYLDRLGEAEGHLVIFDRRTTIPWDDKVYIKEAAGPAGQRIHVFGL